MRTVEVMSLLQTLQMYLTPPPEPESARGADLALVMRPMLCYAEHEDVVARECCSDRVCQMLMRLHFLLLLPIHMRDVGEGAIDFSSALTPRGNAWL